MNMWESGDTLIEEDTSDDPGLFLVLKGVVSMSQINSEDGSTVEIHRSYGGGCFGQLQVLTDEPSFFTVTVIQDEAGAAAAAGETVVAKLEAEFIRRVSHSSRNPRFDNVTRRPGYSQRPSRLS